MCATAICPVTFCWSMCIDYFYNINSHTFACMITNFHVIKFAVSDLVWGYIYFLKIILQSHRLKDLPIEQLQKYTSLLLSKLSVPETSLADLFFPFLSRDLSVDAGLPPHQYHIHPLPQHYQHYLTSPRMHHFPRNNASTQVVSSPLPPYDQSCSSR